ncbi:MAG: segregation/condensation protein A [Peptoniphilus sp.]|nr:segregation/condensation protein A [Peptoniphilus sp.]MDY3119251.1 segregation/condensation protein A [Peptoniphilus sp.]
MSYEFVYGSFSGPMEVLLELIKNREMDIYDIQIHVLVDDFIAYIDGMKGPVLDSIADFLAMASYLLAIKSRMLLPKPVLEEGEEEEDPRAGLVERIVEYKRIKAASLLLDEMAAYEGGAIYKKQEDFSDFTDEELLAEGNADRLAEAFKEVMLRFETHEAAQRSLEKIPAAEFSFKQATEKIEAAFCRWKCPRFLHMMEDAKSRIEIVTVFLALLELMKLQKITCRQEGNDIVLTKRGMAHGTES